MANHRSSVNEVGWSEWQYFAHAVDASQWTTRLIIVFINLQIISPESKWSVAIREGWPPTAFSLFFWFGQTSWCIRLDVLVLFGLMFSVLVFAIMFSIVMYPAFSPQCWATVTESKNNSMEFSMQKCFLMGGHSLVDYQWVQGSCCRSAFNGQALYYLK